ncbi:MAG: putative lipopolysaccharide heptosyltransferase III [Nitrospirae bacterium]|nr:putative lipopolysaccharide heptosyltransferase III [Nitrospirota bacterium]
MTFNNINKIVVIKLRHIGDVLLTTPVFKALRQKFPTAEISAVVNSGTEDALKCNQDIDIIITFQREIKHYSYPIRLLKEAQFLRYIRRQAFDMSIDLTGGDRAAIISLISGARYRLGIESKEGFPGKKYLYTHPSTPNRDQHMVIQNLQVVEKYGIKPINYTVTFTDCESGKDWLQNLFKNHKITLDTPIIHVHPTSRWLFKCWKDEYMAEVLQWAANNEITVILTSSKDEKEIKRIKNILSLTQPTDKIINLSGRTTLQQLGTISKASDLFLGVDSAPMHIAAAVGTPVLALFGPSCALNWGPWDNNIITSRPNKSPEHSDDSSILFPYTKNMCFGIHTIIQKDWACIPCRKDGCNGTKISNCLYEISPDEVKSIIKTKLMERSR